MARARGANALMRLAFETTYGTPPVGTYSTLPFVSTNIGAERGLIESDLLGFGRRRGDPVSDVTNNDGDVVVPVDTTAMGIWLKLLLGAPVSAAVTDAGKYDHSFSSDTASLPSASIEIGHPDVPSYSMNYGIRAGTLRVSMQRSGLLSATIGLMGKGTTVPASSPATGSPTTISGPRFAQARGSIDNNGASLGTIVSANFSYSNGMEKVEAIRPDGEIADVDPGMPMASGDFVAKFDSNALYNMAVAGDPIILNHQWSTADGQQLVVQFPRVFLPRPKRPIEGPGGIQASFSWQASAAGFALCLASLRNTKTSYA